MFLAGDWSVLDGLSVPSVLNKVAAVGWCILCMEGISREDMMLKIAFLHLQLEFFFFNFWRCNFTSTYQESPKSRCLWRQGRVLFIFILYAIVEKTKMCSTLIARDVWRLKIQWRGRISNVSSRQKTKNLRCAFFCLTD